MSGSSRSKSGGSGDDDGQSLTAGQEDNENNRGDRFREMVEANPAQLWTAQPDGGLDYVNPQVASYAGLPADVLLGDGWGRIVHPLDLTRAVERWRSCLQSGETYTVEMRLQRGLDLQYRWHRTIAEPVRNSRGEIVQWVGTNNDIDEQKRAVEIADAAQMRTQQERERLRRIFHLAPAAITLYHGPSFITDLINPTAEAILGAGRAVLGKPLREVVPELEDDGIFDILDRVYATGEPFQAKGMRLVFTRAGETEPSESFWDFVLQPLNDAGEPVTDILSHAVEVTDMVLARQQRLRADNTVSATAARE